MTNINLKYPITFRKNTLKLDEVPDELFLHQTDYRRYNRMLCKTDLVQWHIYNNLESQTVDEGSAIHRLTECNAKRLSKV